MSQSELLIRAIDTLDAASIEYMLTGSMASGLIGKPRATHDIDIVVRLRLEDCPKVLASFQNPDYYVSADAVRQAVLGGGMFNVIQVTTGDKIDFWMLPREEYDHEAFGRRIRIAFEQRSIAVPRPEDLILLKLRWAKQSGGSEKQLADVRGIVEVNRDALDRSYLERWAQQLGLAALWAQADQRP